MGEAKDSEKIKSAIRVSTKRAPIADAGGTTAERIGLPPYLYLHVDGHVEWSALSGHAWGRASVSSDASGATPFPVASISLHIVMDTPEQQNKINTANNAAQVDNDVVYGSTFNPIFSGPHSVFTATASDPRYGTWSTHCSVY